VRAWSIWLRSTVCSDALPQLPDFQTRSSAALLTTYALSPYVQEQNHVAIFEGWIVYIACLIALVEKYDLEQACWKDSLDIAVFAVQEALSQLCNELKERPHLVEGIALLDTPFYRGRLTWLIGLVSSFALWCYFSDPNFVPDNWLNEFVEKHQSNINLWGEGAIPSFLAYFWYKTQFAPSSHDIGILIGTIEGICALGLNEKSLGLASPYYSLPEIVMRDMGMSSRDNTETLHGRSYTLELLIQLVAKNGYRQHLNRLWHRITRMVFARFIPDAVWQFCLWHSEQGLDESSAPKMPQSWSELQLLARKVELATIPRIFQEYPFLLLMFVLVYPHRLTVDVAKFLDDRLSIIRQQRGK
jgi:hypothetical protein